MSVTSSTDAQLPLVLLDFDGVFNALAILMEMTEWPDGRNHSATMPSGTHGFSYSPTVAQFFTERSHLAEFIWLSTWEETPAYGLAMEMPEFSWLGTEGLSNEPTAPWWKFEIVQQLAAQFPERRILWIDDEIPVSTEDTIARWLQLNSEQVSFLRPDDFHGLRAADLIRIESFLNS